MNGLRSIAIALGVCMLAGCGSMETQKTSRRTGSATEPTKEANAATSQGTVEEQILALACASAATVAAPSLCEAVKAHGLTDASTAEVDTLWLF